jgi:hypothetical protein
MSDETMSNNHSNKDAQIIETMRQGTQLHRAGGCPGKVAFDHRTMMFSCQTCGLHDVGIEELERNYGGALANGKKQQSRSSRRPKSLNPNLSQRQSRKRHHRSS